MTLAIDLPVRGGATFYLADQGECVLLKHLGLTAEGHAFLAERNGHRPKAYQISIALLNEEWMKGTLYAVGRQPPWVGASINP